MSERNDYTKYVTDRPAWIREKAPIFLAKLRAAEEAGDTVERRRIWAMSGQDMRDEITRISKENVQ